jgi:hypothetical protein
VTIDDVIAHIDDLPLSERQKQSLISKLNAASDAINRENLTAACNQLEAFINQVSALAQSDELDQATATRLIDEAQAIETTIGCP